MDARKETEKLTPGQLQLQIDSKLPSVRGEFKKQFDSSDSWNQKTILKQLKKWLMELNHLLDSCRAAGMLSGTESSDHESDSEESIGAESLQKMIAHLEFSLLERRLHFRKKVAVKYPDESIEATYIAAYRKLRDSHAPSHLPISLTDLIDAAQITCPDSMEGSAKAGLRHLILEKMTARIDAHQMQLTDLPQLDKLYQSNLLKAFDAKDMRDQIRGVIQTKVIEPRVAAFKKIYTALREGQSGFFKTNFVANHSQLSDEEMYQQILAHIAEKPDSRTAKAWALADRHYRNCSHQNHVLFTEIYKYSFEKSGYFFKRSQITGVTFYSSANLNQAAQAQFTSEQVVEAASKTGSRSAKIYRSLGLDFNG